MPQDFTEVRSAFDVCDVHDCALQAPPKEDLAPEIRDTAEYEQAVDSKFPFAINSNWICPECHAAREKWIAENQDLCRILRCQTTYESFFRRQTEGMIDRIGGMTEKVRQRSAEIAAEMKPGDELWEWDAGGWHRLAGRKGIAIVRGGRIVKEWCEIMS